MVAVRDIAPLELILTERPAVVGPYSKSPVGCLQCFRRPRKGAPAFACPKCGFPVCDEKCAGGDLHQVWHIKFKLFFKKNFFPKKYFGGNQIECAFLASKLRLEQEAEGDEMEAKENGDADSSSSNSSSSSNRSHRGNVVELNGDVELAPNKSELI